MAYTNLRCLGTDKPKVHRVERWRRIFRGHALTYLWCVGAFSFSALGCDDDPPSAPEAAGDIVGGTIGGVAGDAAGDTAGDTAGNTAGSTAGDTAGDTAGGTAGDTAGGTAGDTAGDMTGGTPVSPLPPLQPPLSGAALSGAERLDDTPPSGVRVGWVDEPEEVLTGVDISCRLGSVRMENSLIRVCIQGDYSLTQFKRRGGNLTDVLRWGAPLRDGISEILVAPGLGEVTPERTEILADGADGGPAVIQVRGVAAGSRILTSYVPSYVPRPTPVVNEYHLYPDTSAVELHTWIEVGDRPISTQLSDFVVWSDPAQIFYPLQEGERIPNGPAYLGAHLPHLSYLWRIVGRDKLSIFSLPGLPFQPVGTGQITAPAGVTLYLKRVLHVGAGGINALARAADLSPPDAVTRTLRVSASTPDGSSISARHAQDPNAITDGLNPAQLLDQVSLELYTIVESDSGEGARGALITQIRTTPRAVERDGSSMIEGGEASLEITPGDYWVRAPSWSGGAIQQRVEVSADVNEPIGITLPAPGLVTLRERLESAGGVALDQRGSKWVFTPIGAGVSERERRIIFVLGSRALTLAPGEWRLQVSRGWHFGISEQTFEVVSGERSAIDVTLREELELSGWSSGEFHQHSAPSLDSAIGFETRIVSNIVEGVGFMVPSDHDVLVDYPSMTRAFGYERDVGAPITGVEISPRAGHLGAYGLTYNSDDPQGAGGAPPLSKQVGESVPGERDSWVVRTIPELIVEARERGAEVIQVNHPRDSTGYFDTVDFDPESATSPSEHPQWTGDFDTLEIFNGAGDVCAVFRDWHALLLRGKRVTAVGNSDSHGLGRPVGYPRNYLPTRAARPQEISRDEVISALRAGRVSIGGGALIELTDGRVWGDEISGARATIGLRLRTPSFAQITRVRAFFNGREVWARELNAPRESLVDLDESIEFEFERDGFLIFFAEGPALGAVHPGQPTFALSNPLWIDSDADGSVTLPQTYVAPESITTSFCP